MEEILIACGDTDLLRQIVADLPPNQYKPIASRKGDGIAAKLADRGIGYAVVHESLSDIAGAVLCDALKRYPQPPNILFLVSGDVPAQGPFDVAVKYPVPGPVFRNALKRIQQAATDEEDLERWRAFYNEVVARREALDQQSYYQMLGVKAGAPHHLIVQVFDAISLRYHPDRYQKHRGVRWGDAVYEQVNELYKAYTEAFGVLADRRLRQRYDEALASGNLRISLDDAGGDSGPRSLVDFSNNPASKKFLKLAQTDLARGQISQALQNLRFALSMEPDNAAIAAKVAELEQNKG
ncbi:MAG: DnaJ domain-containing protein [bacterium]